MMNKKYSGKFVIRLPESLHVGLSRSAESEGVSLNQYCVYLLSKHLSSQMLLDIFDKADRNLAGTNPKKIDKIIRQVIKEVRSKK